MAVSKKVDLRAPGKNGFRYKQQFGVVVVCRDEGHQRAVFERLQRMRLKLRVVTV